jgi:hypothetical protein
VKLPTLFVINKLFATQAAENQFGDSEEGV